jgi:predicted secreted protein
MSSSGRVDVRVGDTFELELEGRATAGYKWAPHLDREVARSVELVGETTEGRPRLGAPTTQRFRFRALRPGTVSLEFRYGRRWETEAKPAKHVVTVNIDER